MRIESPPVFWDAADDEKLVAAIAERARLDEGEVARRLRQVGFLSER